MSGTQLRPGTTTLPEVAPELDEDTDDTRMAHYVKREDVLRSAVDGVPAVALCGKRWFPGRDPDRYPVCPVCKELVELAEQL